MSGDHRETAEETELLDAPRGHEGPSEMLLTCARQYMFVVILSQEAWGDLLLGHR